MDIKDKVDIIAKQADIIYKKIFIFSAIAGGSWIYGIKTSGYLGFIIWIVFILYSRRSRTCGELNQARYFIYRIRGD